MGKQKHRVRAPRPEDRQVGIGVYGREPNRSIVRRRERTVGLRHQASCSPSRARLRYLGYDGNLPAINTAAQHLELREVSLHILAKTAQRRRVRPPPRRLRRDAARGRRREKRLVLAKQGAARDQSTDKIEFRRVGRVGRTQRFPLANEQSQREQENISTSAVLSLHTSAAPLYERRRTIKAPGDAMQIVQWFSRLQPTRNPETN